MKKMAKMYAAEEAMKHAIPHVTRQFKNMTSSSQNNPSSSNQSYQRHQDEYRRPPEYSYNQPSSSQSQHGSQQSQLSGALSSLGKVAGKVARGTGRAAVTAGKKVQEMIDAEKMKDMLKEGNVVQLISLSSGQSLQILQAGNGQLMLNGQGGIGHEYFNAHFHVMIDSRDGGITLHNQYNYLAIVNGQLTLLYQEPGRVPQPSTKFKAKSYQPHYLQIESVIVRNHCIQVAPNGAITPTNCPSKGNPDAQFSINVIFKASR